MRSTQLTEQTVHRNTQSPIDRVGELIDDISTCKTRRTGIATVGAIHLNIAVYYGCHHAITDTLTVRNVTHDIISLVSCHAIAIVNIDATIRRADHITTGILIENIRGRANLRLQSCLRNLVEHGQYLTVLRKTVMLRTYQLVYIILFVTTCSVFYTLRHQTCKAYNRLVTLEHLDTTVGCYLRTIPCRINYCFLLRASHSHAVEVSSIQRSALGIHEHKQQFVELIIATHIRIISISICVLILCLMNRLQRRYKLTRITCTARLEHFL